MTADADAEAEAETRDGAPPKTRVGHVTRDADQVDHYVGRSAVGGGTRDLHSDVAPGTPGWLGNPYTLDELPRLEAIAAYREDFEERLREDDEFRAAVRDLAGDVLGCYCRPLDVGPDPACHADVIAEHADRLAREADAADEETERDLLDETVSDLRARVCDLVDIPEPWRGRTSLRVSTLSKAADAIGVERSYGSGPTVRQAIRRRLHEREEEAGLSLVRDVADDRPLRKEELAQLVAALEAADDAADAAGEVED